MSTIHVSTAGDTRSQQHSAGGPEKLLGIGEAAAAAGVSERALRYYQDRGLLSPVCTPGGFRRYTGADLVRVARIRELQTLLGFNLDEIATVLCEEDRLEQIRAVYHAPSTNAATRRALRKESLTIHERLRATAATKRDALNDLLADLEAHILNIHAVDAARSSEAATRVQQRG